MFDGSRAIFEKAKRQDSVGVFPVLPDGKILLTKQEQPGNRLGAFIGLPGGRVDEGEDVLEAAKRELLEETGYEAKDFTLWFAINTTPKVDWAVYFFIAKGLQKTSDFKLDAGEKIDLFSMTLDELIEIGADQNSSFADKSIETLYKFIEAKYNPDKKRELEELFKP